MTVNDLAELSDDSDVLDEGVEGEAIAPADLSAGEVAIQTEHLEGRQRRIVAQIQIPYGIEQVWGILTDYDHLADFIPNLAQSRRIEHPEGGIRLEQVGTESLLKLKVCLRVVLDMVEHFPSELQFSMIEGDFRTFDGAWQLEPLPDKTGTLLRYVVTLLPPRAIPIRLIEGTLRRNLTSNLQAIRQRANDLFGAIAPAT